MSESRKVTALIVTYQSIETIGHTLDAFYPAFECGYASCVVVDNASSDGTAEYVAERYPWVKLIRSTENLGFGRGNNLGFRSVETPLLLLLNPDASIRLDGLKVLVEFLDSHPKVGIVGPSTWAIDKGYQSAGSLLTPMRLIRASLGFVARREGGDRVIEPGCEPFQTTWICGAVFMIRSSLFRELDGFDPRYFLYYEETDLCLSTLRKGYEIWAVGEASSEHHCGISAKRSGKVMTSDTHAMVNKHYFESRYYYMRKNFGWLSAAAAELVSAIMGWVRWQRKKFRQRGESQGIKPPKRPIMKLPKQVKLIDED